MKNTLTQKLNWAEMQSHFAASARARLTALTSFTLSLLILVEIVITPLVGEAVG